MSQLLLQVVIVVAFGAFCFGCGYLTAFIVTRNQWRDEMIKRGVARYNWTTGKWEWGEPPKESKYCNARPPPPNAMVHRSNAELFYCARRQRSGAELHLLRKRTRSPLGSEVAQQRRGAADCGEYCEVAGTLRPKLDFRYAERVNPLLGTSKQKFVSQTQVSAAHLWQLSGHP